MFFLYMFLFYYLVVFLLDTVSFAFVYPKFKKVYGKVSATKILTHAFGGPFVLLYLAVFNRPLLKSAWNARVDLVKRNLADKKNQDEYDDEDDEEEDGSDFDPESERH